MKITMLGNKYCKTCNDIQCLVISSQQKNPLALKIPIDAALK